MRRCPRAISARTAFLTASALPRMTFAMLRSIRSTSSAELAAYSAATSRDIIRVFYRALRDQGQRNRALRCLHCLEEIVGKTPSDPPASADNSGPPLIEANRPAAALYARNRSKIGLAALLHSTLAR